MTYAGQLRLINSLERFEAKRRRIVTRRAMAERAKDIKTLVRLAHLQTAIDRRENELV
jgi:hypothetical protein